MTGGRLEVVVSEIADILRQCGVYEKASWLDERVSLLHDIHASSADQGRAISELHSVVLGMGGLLDLQLVPISRVAEKSTSLRKRLDQLSDELFELTVPEKLEKGSG